MKFFFDRCMSPKLCRMTAILEEGTHVLAHHDDDGRFCPTTSDIEWINALTGDADSPVVVTGDCRILKRPDEVAALNQSGLTFVILADKWAEFPIPDMTWKFFKVWPDILKTVRKSRRRPTVFQVRAGSSLKVETYGLTGQIGK